MRDGEGYRELGDKVYKKKKKQKASTSLREHLLGDGLRIA
jgi:hypothetical protein